MDKRQKEQFSVLAEFLAKTLGKNYEVALHDINEKGSSVAAIFNNHISNRTVNSPLTGFALELLQNKTYLEKDFLVDYKAKTSKGKTVRGSTFFIKDGNKIQGMLCINQDQSAYEEISTQILELANISPNSHDTTKPLSHKNSEITEYLSESIEEIISQTINPELLSEDINLRPEKKQELIELLYNKGVFNIKGGVIKVAQILNMSEQSVYRYIKKMR